MGLLHSLHSLMLDFVTGSLFDCIFILLIPFY